MPHPKRSAECKYRKKGMSWSTTLSGQGHWFYIKSEKRLLSQCPRPQTLLGCLSQNETQIKTLLGSWHYWSCSMTSPRFISLWWIVFEVGPSLACPFEKGHEKDHEKDGQKDREKDNYEYSSGSCNSTLAGTSANLCGRNVSHNLYLVRCSSKPSKYFTSTQS